LQFNYFQSNDAFQLQNVKESKKSEKELKKLSNGPISSTKPSHSTSEKEED
jgi:hypothetical protein